MNPILLVLGLVARGYPSAAPAAVAAIPVSRFLDSIGTQSAIATRGESLSKTIECTKYLGVRWLRAGIEGDVPIRDFVELHRETGVRFSWGLGSGGSAVAKLIATGKQIAAAGALLAFEGPNEPNNWGIEYGGHAGGRNGSWLAVAALQRDLYAAVKTDPALMRYAVWTITEPGAEVDNVGLQFLTIPAGANTTMPPGTRYADAANVHNYIYHPNAPGLADNKTWDAADPGPGCKVDGLYGEYGRTWLKHYAGYPERELATLPRVTTETGCTIEGPITEEVHALNLLSMYLDQFKRGWSYTNVYLLRDRVDEGGNQKFGFFRPDYTPRKAAVYLHNLTTILAYPGAPRTRRPAGRLDYDIAPEVPTVHDMLLQKNDGTFELVVWDEQVTGSTDVVVRFSRPHGAVRLFDPTRGTEPVRTISSAAELRLSLSDHPVVIELR